MPSSWLVFDELRALSTCSVLPVTVADDALVLLLLMPVALTPLEELDDDEGC